MVKKSKRQQLAYDYIKKNISEGNWSNDIRLVEKDISMELGISRTPVRDAINMLISEGYLIKETNRGAIVKKQTISRREFIERTQLLELLLSHYLFQIQIKHLSINTDALCYHQHMLQDETDISKSQNILKNILSHFLESLDNHIMKQIILTNFEQIHYARFSNLDYRGICTETVFLFQNLTKNIGETNYEQGRKNIRVYFNRLNLKVIEHQLEKEEVI